MAYYGLEPWGEQVADNRSGMLACLIANANRDTKKHPRPFTPKDFIPDYERRGKEQTPEEMIQVARMWNAMYGGTEA